MSINGKKIIPLILITVFIFTGCEKSNLDISFDEHIKGENKIIREINDQFELLPKLYQDFIIKEGFKIHVTTDDISSHYDVPSSICAISDLKNKEVYINNEHIDEALHEFCHLVCFNEKANTSFYIQYTGYEKEMKKMKLSKYYQNYDEYIVEAMANYLKDKTSLDKYSITKKTVIEMLSGDEWKYETG